MLIRILAVMLSLFVLTGQTLASDLTLSGEVFYRERMALPTGTTLHVGLVTLPEGRPVVGAGAAVPAGGQVPLKFSLAVRSDIASSGGSFGLVAEIRFGNGLLFRNDAAVPVDLAAPTPATILVTRQPFEEPVAEPTGDPRLLSSTWQVTSIGGSPAKGAVPLTLSIAPDFRAGGHAGCNAYFTEATMDGTALTFGLAAATHKACLPELMAQEQAFFAALAAVSSYEVSENSLRLLDAAGIPLMGLVRAGE